MEIMPKYSRATLKAIRFEHIESSKVAPQRLKTILNAIEAKGIIEFKYHTPRGEVTRRKIAPLRLINYQWRWYVFGFCFLRHDMRMFHLPRMSKVHFLKEQFKLNTPDENEIEEILNASFGIFKGEPGSTAKIKFFDDAAFIVSEQNWHRDQTMEWLSARELLLTVPITTLNEIAMKILQYGGRAQVLDPQELREYVKNEAARISQMYA